MDKLKMMSMDKVQANIEKIRELFPNAVKEVAAKDNSLTEIAKGKGEYKLAIDFEVLKQELADNLIDDRELRFQFTWPDKQKAILLANTPIDKTLRPVKDDETTPTGEDSDGNPYCSTGSVDFDTAQNLYIEGDNLEVLKLLQETYLGKIKMIYIDPPYNTGNDFVYNDDFAQDSDDYMENSGQFDEQGNRLFQNTESNGRFHTDWLNMIYPRLRLAKDLLSDDGVIFISIDDNEAENLKKVCNEIFGDGNFVASFPWRKRTAKSDVPYGISQDYEQIICYARSEFFSASVEGKERKYFTTDDYPGRPWRIHDLTKQTTASERPNSYFTIVNPKNGKQYPANPNATWRITSDTFDDYYAAGRIIFPGDYTFLNISKPVLRYWKEDDIKKAGDSFGRVAVSTKLPEDIGMSQDGTKETTDVLGAKVFNFPKPVSLIKFLMQIINDKGAIILDFFSGSATTAHAVMQLNAEDGGNRKFILVQLPEVCDEKSEAYKAGYKNICEIGKERIRRVGAKIKKEVEELNAKPIYITKNGSGQVTTLFDTATGIHAEGKDLTNHIREEKIVPDIGFRVLKLDSSNMQPVYYHPEAYKQTLLDDMTDNIKADRTPLDLLFQVMLDLGKPLSAKIEEREIAGKHVFIVNDDDLIACFDSNVTEETVKAIAQLKPLYAIFRDSSLANDSTAANFDQIFATYSPNTVRKVL